MYFDPSSKSYKETFEAPLSLNQVREKFAAIIEAPLSFFAIPQQRYEGKLDLKGFEIKRSSKRSTRRIFAYFIVGKLQETQKGTKIELEVQQRMANPFNLPQPFPWVLLMVGFLVLLYIDIKKTSGSSDFNAYKYLTTLPMVLGIWFLARSNYHWRSQREIDFIKKFLKP